MGNFSCTRRDEWSVNRLTDLILQTQTVLYAFPVCSRIQLSEASLGGAKEGGERASQQSRFILECRYQMKRYNGALSSFSRRVRGCGGISFLLRPNHTVLISRFSTRKATSSALFDESRRVSPIRRRRVFQLLLSVMAGLVGPFAVLNFSRH